MTSLLIHAALGALTVGVFFQWFFNIRYVFTYSRLVERAARGEEIIIAKAGKPMAKLVAVSGRVARQGLTLVTHDRRFKASAVNLVLPTHGRDENGQR